MRKFKLLCFMALLTISLPQPSGGEERQAPVKRPKIALVLSGGGARGIAHIGVLKALEQLKVPIDMIVGTSMGAIAGGLYASGYSPEQLEEMVIQAPWDTIFSNEESRSDMPYRQKPDKKNYFLNLGLDYKYGFILPKALIQAKKLEMRLRAWTVGSPDDFSRFHIPFTAVATDIATGETVVLSRGDIARSLRASMSVPGAFEPVKIGGKMLVDGGVSDQLPVDIAKKMGADIIIAVNVGTPLEASGKLRSVIDITNQLTGILTNKSVIVAEKLLTENDVLITPDLKDFSNMDFTKAAVEIDLGMKAALEVRDKLSRYAASEAYFSEYIDNQRRRQDSPYEFIELQTPYGNYKEDIEIKDQDILNIIDTKLIGRRIFRNRQFELVDFSVVEFNGKQGLLLKTELSDLGPDVIRFGFETEDDFQGDANYNVLFGYTVNKINRLGADWKNEAQIGQTNRFFTEFYQPFGKRLWMPFVAPWFEAKNSSMYFYENSEKIAEYRTRDITGEFDIGVQLGCIGEIRLGMAWNNFKLTPKIAPSDWSDEEIDDAAYEAKLKIDTLDNLYFPQHGVSVYAEARIARKYLGADISYDMYRAEASAPFAFGRSVIMPLVKAGSCQGLDLDLKYFGYFTLGGFQNLSGLYPDQIMGNQMLFGELVYFYRIWELPRAIGKSIYAGLSAEAGNVWDTASERSINDLTAAGSVFVGLETLIGPFYLGYGMAEKGQSAFYFYLGRMF